MVDTAKVMSVYSSIKEKVVQTAPEGFIRFADKKETIGYVRKDIAMKLAGTTSDFRLTDVLSFSDATVSSEASRTLALRKAADILGKLNLLPEGVSNELVDIRLSVYDGTYCQAPRNLARVLGLLTTSVRLNAYDAQGDFLLAKRMPEKAIGAGKWDSLAGGLVKASEQPMQALYRELYEEAGLTTSEVEITEGARFVQEFAVAEGMVREVVLSFDGRLKAGVKPANQDGSVSEFKSMSTEEALTVATNGDMMYAAAISICESAMRQCGQRIEEKWLHYRGQLNI